jgi:hypothetical protein
MAAGGAGVLLLWPAPAPTFDQITFRPSRISGARFTADGGAVIYSEAQRGNALEVWRHILGESPPASPLDLPAGSDVLAVQSGEVALVLERRYVVGQRFVGTLAIALTNGGSPHLRAEDVDSCSTRLKGPSPSFGSRPTASASRSSRIRRPAPWAAR